mgnify:CR=1 FL=1
MADKNFGKIVAIIGPVLDVEFEAGKLPEIYNALRISAKIADGTTVEIIAEVEQHLGENRVRVSGARGRARLDLAYGAAPRQRFDLFMPDGRPRGLVVFVHELGHFIAAKLCGVYAPVFSLGWGSRLFGVRRGETDYRVSLIPLGGFVRMATREDDSELHRVAPPRPLQDSAGPRHAQPRRGQRAFHACRTRRVVLRDDGSSPGQSPLTRAPDRASRAQGSAPEGAMNRVHFSPVVRHGGNLPRGNPGFFHA